MTEDEELKTGHTVYNRAGRRAEYIQKLDHGHLVRPIMTAWVGGGDDVWEEDAPDDGLDIWPEVSRVAPTAELHEEAAALAIEIADAHKRLNEIRGEGRQAERENEALRKRLARFDPLKNLDELLNGSITHFVVPGAASVSISTFDAKAAYGGPEDRYDREKKFRLLSLDLRPNGSLGWSLSGYADGSGMSADNIYPCTSIEDAKTVGYNYIVARLASVEFSQYPHLWIEAVKGITDLGFEVPADIARLADQAVVDREQKIITLASENLARAKEALDGAKARLADVTKKGA